MIHWETATMSQLERDLAYKAGGALGLKIEFTQVWNFDTSGTVPALDRVTI